MSEDTADRTQSELDAKAITGSGPWRADPDDPWAPGPTFRDSYLAGDLPWPRESLFWGNEGGTDNMVNEYLQHIREVRAAAVRGDERAVRRLRGEIEAGEHEFKEMDPLWAAETFSDMRAALASQTESDAHCCETTPAPAGPSVTAPETERFVGPAPFYRRGRIYVQGLAWASEGASNDDVDRSRYEDADQLLRVVEACEDPEELQDFIAGVTREIKRQLARRHLTEDCDRGE